MMDFGQQLAPARLIVVSKDSTRQARSDDVSRWTIVGGGDDVWLNVVTMMPGAKVARCAAV